MSKETLKHTNTKRQNTIRQFMNLDLLTSPHNYVSRVGGAPLGLLSPDENSTVVASGCRDAPFS